MTAPIPTPDEIDAMTAAERKTFEARCRREARSQGFRLKKSQKRSRAGRPFALIHVKLQRVLWVEGCGSSQLTLADVAEWLWGDD
jgi:hypothetical protein